MVFGFFSKKPSAPAAQADVVANTKLPETLQQTQLRTPSPSIESVSREPGASHSPSSRAMLPPISPSPPPHPTSADLGLITDAKPLHALIASIPPKVLHEYTLAHLIPPPHSQYIQGGPTQTLNGVNLPPPGSRGPSSSTLTHLTSFFSLLAPPPRLHCVRCHKFYVEVDNDDRSCLVAHDDESAEVERAGNSNSSSHYQTLFGCCGRTVEGNGDMGPPDGWCYEGKHTTDIRRARFRLDSTPYDDKLVSCDRLSCFQPIPTSNESDGSSVKSKTKRKRKPRASAPKRPLKDEKEEEEETDPEENKSAGLSHKRKPTISMSAAEPPVPKKKLKSTNVAKEKEQEKDKDAETEKETRDSDEDKKPMPKVKSMKRRKAPTKRDPNADNAPFKPHLHGDETDSAEGELGSGMEIDDEAPVKKKKSAMKQKSRKSLTVAEADLPSSTAASFGSAAAGGSISAPPHAGHKKGVSFSEPKKKRKPKPLEEVVSSSVPGEEEMMMG